MKNENFSEDNFEFENYFEENGQFQTDENTRNVHASKSEKKSNFYCKKRQKVKKNCILNCSFCGKVFRHLKTFEKHVKLHKTDSSNHDRLYYININTPVMFSCLIHPCDDCGLLCVSKNDYVNHMKIWAVVSIDCISQTVRAKPAGLWLAIWAVVSMVCICQTVRAKPAGLWSAIWAVV